MHRQGDWKFVLNWQPVGGARELDELYNLAEDPHEMHNLAYENREQAERMRDRILEWLEEAGHPYVHTIREMVFLEPSRR